MISTVLPPPPSWLPVRVVLGGLLASCVIAGSGGAGFFSGWAGLVDPALMARGGRSMAVFSIALLTGACAAHTLSWLAAWCGQGVTITAALVGRAVALFPVAALAWSFAGWWIGILGKPVETLMPFQPGGEVDDWRLMFGAAVWQYLAPALVLAVPLGGELLGGAGLPLRPRLQSLCLLGPAWLIIIEDALQFHGWGGWMAQAIRAGEAANAAAGLAWIAWPAALFCLVLRVLPAPQETSIGASATISWLPWPLWVLALGASLPSPHGLWFLMWLVILGAGLPACRARMRGGPATSQAFQLIVAGVEALSQGISWLAALAMLHPLPPGSLVMRAFQPLLITTPARAAEALAAPARILHPGLLLLGGALALHLLGRLLTPGAPDRE